MLIQSMQFVDDEQTAVRIETSDEGTMTAPWPVQTWHAEVINEWLEAGNTIAPVPPTPLADVAADKKRELVAAAQAEINSIAAADYPDFAMDTWAIQEQEARALLADATAATPNLDIIATRRGIDRTELANRVVAKADQFRQLAFTAEAERQGLEDDIDVAVNAATNGTITEADARAQIEAIVWPGVTPTPAA